MTAVSFFFSSLCVYSDLAAIFTACANESHESRHSTGPADKRSLPTVAVSVLGLRRGAYASIGSILFIYCLPILPRDSGHSCGRSTRETLCSRGFTAARRGAALRTVVFTDVGRVGSIAGLWWDTNRRRKGIGPAKPQIKNSRLTEEKKSVRKKNQFQIVVLTLGDEETRRETQFRRNGPTSVAYQLQGSFPSSGVGAIPILIKRVPRAGRLITRGVDLIIGLCSPLRAEPIRLHIHQFVRSTPPAPPTVQALPSTTSMYTNKDYLRLGDGFRVIASVVVFVRGCRSDLAGPRQI
ncbi:hypothetical protein J6590_026967 [Homalodisca vitripennis]|nr:hypothetical protein J6590_026967 [Homalodisca vitripennis]